MFGEPCRVVVERAHLHRASGPAARRQEAMAVGDRGRYDFLYRGRFRQFCSANRERDDTSAIEIENPANGAPEQQIALAILEICIPMHRLGKAERSQRCREDIGQYVDSRAATLMFAISEIGPFWRLHTIELRNIDIVLTRESNRRRRWRTVRSECG